MIAQNEQHFIDSDFAKDYIMSVVETICPEKKQKFSNIRLSSRTITRLIEELFGNIKSSQQNKLNNLQCLSIGTDEITDATNTVQIGIFIAYSQTLIYLKIL